MEETIANFVSEIEFVANIDEYKDCLMNQHNHQNDPGIFWFNIDVPKGHGLKTGDKVRIIIQRA